MRRFVFGLVISAGALAFVAGCGGSGKKAAPTNTPLATAAADAADGPSSDQKSQTDALLHSSSSASAAQSFAGTFHATAGTGGLSFDEDGTMAFQAPDTVYMNMSLLGQSFSMLVMAPDIYIEVPGEGWFSAGDSLIDRDAYAQYAKNRGPVDYAGIMSTLTDSKQLADDPIEGKTYHHYSGTFDLGAMLDKVPSDVFKQQAQAGVDLLKDAPPSTVEVWLDPDNDLPRRMTMDMGLPIAGKDFSMQMTLDYTSWNEPVDIPAAPTNPRPFSDLTGALKP